MVSFKGKVIMVTGATGSFGNQFITQLRDSGAKRIICLSRDELKQFDMAEKYKGWPIELQFILGDIRDRTKVFSAMRGVDYLVHAAALKQVPTGENFPEEIIKTNIIGVQNIVDGADYNGVERGVYLSSDKAAFPANIYGASKFISEGIVLAHKGDTINVCLRYGNVLGSRGSVIPLWKNQIENNMPISITSYLMTRFVLSLSQAVQLATRCFDGENKELIVMKPPATSILNLSKSLELYYGRALSKKIIGVRPGEKTHETLLMASEVFRGHEERDGDVTYVRVPRNNNNDFYGSGELRDEPKDFTSLDAEQLNPEQVLAKLKEAKLL